MDAICGYRSGMPFPGDISGDGYAGKYNHSIRRICSHHEDTGRGTNYRAGAGPVALYPVSEITAETESDFHSDNPNDYIAGFPWHPHRGIETITYMLHGKIEHGDSLGNGGIIEAGDVQFFELAYLETSIIKKTHGYIVKLEDFVIPNLDLIPEEVKKKIKKWSDYIDYWSVDWDYKNDTFHNMWQAYRTKQDRTLQLKTDSYAYSKKGKYKIMIKVIDIFGNDTTQLLEHKSE